jgi:hypothetical protein
MDSRDLISDFFSFLLGAVLLSMGAFLFFNQVMVSSQPIGPGDCFGLLLIPLVIGGGLIVRSLRGYDGDKQQKERDDLIAELEAKLPASGGPPEGKPSGRQSRLPAAASQGFGRRLLLAVVLLASGAAAAKPGRETRYDLLAAGWQEPDQGVFTRRCQDNCRRPVPYGGRVVDVMEVNCLERPCGDIRVALDVLDGRGQVIDRIEEIRRGRQGERLPIVLESQNAGASRFVLQSFSAKARLD